MVAEIEELTLKEVDEIQI